MSFFSRLFGQKSPSITNRDGLPKHSGELISELIDGANLVDGKETWESVQDKKDDIEHMKRCCDAELKTMELSGFVSAPYYFERVAILSRKAKDYEQEIHYCEIYIKAVRSFYAKHGTRGIADVRKGPRYAALVARLPKAKELLKKSKIKPNN